MTYTLTVTDQDLAVISAALGELQFKVAAALFSKLQQQVEQQKAGEGERADMAALQSAIPAAA